MKLATVIVGCLGTSVLLACGGSPKRVPEGMSSVTILKAAKALSVPEAREPESPWNMIVISVDTLRADHLGIYGYGRDTSPSVDAFGESGIVFENAFSQSPKTASSHMTMFTGVYPASHGVVTWTEEKNTRLSSSVPTLATLLRQAGYRCEAYTGGGNVRAELGFDQGFDVYQYAGHRAFDRGAQALDRLASTQTKSAGRSFFLFIHTYQVHDPYLPPPSYRELFADPRYRGDILGIEEFSEATSWREQHIAFWDSVDLDDAMDVQHLVDLYDAGIRVADDQFSTLLEAVRRLGLLENTIVLFTSDHGEEFTEHGSVLHDSVYQEILAVPFLLHLPPRMGFQAQGKRIVETIRLIDLTPTLLDLAGLTIPEHMMGRSIVPLLGDSEVAMRPVFAEFLEQDMASLAAGNWKIVLAGRHWRREELYDLRSDPAESVDLSASNKEEAAYLESKLLELRRESAKLATLAGRGTEVELDDAARKELEALGYLGGKN